MRMKKFFTLIAMALVAVGVNAQIQTIASYTVTTSSTLAGEDNTADEGTGCSVQLHAGEIKANDGDATKYGASLNSEKKYIQIDFNDALEAGDIVKLSYFVTKNPGADNTEGISVSNVKVGADGYEVLAQMYVQAADQKSIVTGSYVAKGGEKKFIVYRLSNTVCFHSVVVTRGSETFSLDFKALDLTTVEKVEAAVEDGNNISYAASSDATIVSWKNTAGQMATVKFKDVPVTLSYKNSSSKEFAKSGKTDTEDYFFQFNSSSLKMNIGCTMGQYITIYPISYTKDCTLTVTGGNVTSVSLPKEKTDAVQFQATASQVVLTLSSGACRINKITITDTATGIQAIKTLKTSNNAAVYNLAGQKVSNNFKGIAIQNGRKVVIK